MNGTLSASLAVDQYLRQLQLRHPLRLRLLQCQLRPEAQL